MTRLVTLFVMFAAAPAMAGKRAIAIFPVTATNSADQRTADGLSLKLLAELKKIGRGSVQLLSGLRLQKSLGEKPSMAIERCGGNTRCTAQLGQKLGVDEVLITNLTQIGASTQLFVVAVNASSGQIARTVIVTLRSPAAIRTSEAHDKLKEALAATGDAPSGGDDLMSLPTSLEGPSAPVATSASRPTHADSATAPVSVPALIVEQPPAGPPPRPLRTVGIIAMSGGVAAAGVGAVLGGLYLSAPRSAPTGLSQIAYAQRVNDANRAALIANVSFIAAGVLTGAGVAMLIADRLGHPPPTTSVGFAPIAGGALVSIERGF